MIHDIYQIPLHKIEVVYNGIDTSLRNRRFHDTAWIEQFKRTHQLKHKRCLLYYGHSGASKGLDYLIQALPQLKKSIPDIHLIINLLPRKRDYKILELISNLQLRSLITLLHGVRQRDLLNLIYLAAATVVPSVSE
jgi:glycosyltransferase involved in cell wall biosynthesis